MATLGQVISIIKEYLTIRYFRSTMYSLKGVSRYWPEFSYFIIATNKLVLTHRFFDFTIQYHPLTTSFFSIVRKTSLDRMNQILPFRGIFFRKIHSVNIYDVEHYKHFFRDHNNLVIPRKRKKI
jgi:hypothetical protein